MLSAALLIELIYLLASGGVLMETASGQVGAADPVKAVGIALLGPYLLGVELASVLLLAGLVAAHRLTGGRDDEDDASGDGARGALGGPEDSSADGGVQP